MVVIRNQLGTACFRSVAVWALAIALSGLPIRGQRGIRGSTSGPYGQQPPMLPGTEPGVFFPTIEPLPNPAAVEDESCLPWDLPDIRGATVSAVRLGVPSKARNLYEKACGAFKKRKLTEAEQYVREAIQKYSTYLAAWVMLGQVLQSEQKMDEAHDACSMALSVDPTYLPPYLCLAELLDRENQWGDLLTWSDRFRGMNLVGDRYAYFYRGVAHFHLHNLTEAQESVLKALAIDIEHHQPGLYFLLGQIYGEQGDLVDATFQIQQFLKFSNARQDKDAARQYLSKLRPQQSAK